MAPSASEKRWLRAVIRRVHPDLFSNLPFERQANSEALKALNQYIDRLSQQQRHKSAVVLNFWVKGRVGLEQVTAELDGSLRNLYRAFELITDEEWADLRDDARGGAPALDVDVLQWLRDTISSAVNSADEHARLKQLVRESRAVAERKHSLAVIKLGELTASSGDLRRQLECLRILDAHLTLSGEGGSDHPRSSGAVARLDGLALRLYHPYDAPSQTYSWVDPAGCMRLEASVMTAHIAEDGTIHLVADRASISAQLASLNVARAHSLSAVHNYWARRQRELLPALKAVLGVKTVWCDNKSVAAQQRCVLWAGGVLGARAAFDAAIGGRRYNFTILVHADDNSPLIDFSPSSSVLQACAPPACLLAALSKLLASVRMPSALPERCSRLPNTCIHTKCHRCVERCALITSCHNYPWTKYILQSLIRPHPDATHTGTQTSPFACRCDGTVGRECCRSSW